MQPRHKFANLRSSTFWVLGLILTVEFLDEFVFAFREAAWPLIRHDLALSYLQVGVLLGVPGFASNLIEPFIGILGDMGYRKALIIGGGIFFSFALAIISMGQGFVALLLAFSILYPASGALVGLSQAQLMDVDPELREYNMTRWTFAGSVGAVAGPLLLGFFFNLGFGWRLLFGLFAFLSAFLVGMLARSAPATGVAKPVPKQSLYMGLRRALYALKRRNVLRWLVLLEASDLLLDILLGFLALYFTDVAGVSASQAGLAIAIWSGVGLAGNFLMIGLLRRIDGLVYVRISAAIELILYTAFLLLPGFLLKAGCLALLSLFNAGWYSVLQARLYAALPGLSGTALALKNISGVFASIIPFLLGVVAEVYNLQVAMWMLLFGPFVLLFGLSGKIHGSQTLRSVQDG